MGCPRGFPSSRAGGGPAARNPDQSGLRSIPYFSPTAQEPRTAPRPWSGSKSKTGPCWGVSLRHRAILKPCSKALLPGRPGPGLRACLSAQRLQPNLTERTGGSPTVRTNSTARRPLTVGFTHAHTHACMHMQVHACTCAHICTDTCAQPHARQRRLDSCTRGRGRRTGCLPPAWPPPRPERAPGPEQERLCLRLGPCFLCTTSRFCFRQQPSDTASHSPTCTRH